MDSKLIFGVAMAVISLGIRWRWPAVPKPVATFGIVAGVGAAVWSLTPTPLPFAGWLIYGAALTVAFFDYWWHRERAVPVTTPDTTERDQERALKQIAKAIEDADLSLLDHPTQDLLRLSKATLNSAFLTLKKVYDISSPNIVAEKDDIEMGVLFPLEIQPYLEAHHVEAAGEAAAKFIARRNLMG